MTTMLASCQLVSKVQQIVVTQDNVGQRLDNFLFTFLRGVPKSRVYRIIRKGELRINKGRVDVSYRLVEGDLIRIPPIRQGEEKPVLTMPDSRMTKILQKSVCYEDDKLLILSKPSGMAVHGGSGVSWGLIEALRAMRPEQKFLELVHRLDRDTSGLVMLAKSRSMLLHLHECMRAGTIHKQYLAVVHRRWQGGKLVDAPLRKFVTQSGERIVKVDPQGKAAQTAFSLLDSNKHASLLQATLLTGRTHQIRVHCAFMGHPILGETKYSQLDFAEQEKITAANRLLLHAHKLVIKLPYSPFTLTVTSEVPAEFQDYCQKLNLKVREMNASATGI